MDDLPLFEVERLDMVELREAAREGVDPFDMNRSGWESTGNELKGMIAAAVLGRDPARRARMEALAFRQVDQGYAPDPVTLAMLVHHGIDPLAWTFAAALNRGIGFTRHSPDFIRLSWFATKTEMRVDGLSWRSGALVLDERLPDAVTTAAPMRPLREVVSHPVLDQFAILVMEAKEAVKGGTELRLVHDGNPVDRSVLDASRLERPGMGEGR